MIVAPELQQNDSFSLKNPHCEQNNMDNRNTHSHSSMISRPTPFIVRTPLTPSNLNLTIGNKRNLEVLGPHSTTPVLRDVLCTQSSRMFEIGRQLRSALSGEVRYGVELTRSKSIFFSKHYLCKKATTSPVAIKIYNKSTVKGLQNNRRSQEKPLYELKIMQMIGQHPNIMTPMEVCHDDQHIYMIMEFCDRGDMFDMVTQSRHLSENVARGYMRQIVAGLGHLHHFGVAHRDLSLENVLIKNDKERGHICLIIDFGMSVFVPKDDVSGNFLKARPLEVAGKPYYIAPEVIERETKYNPMLCDIWALGVIMFMMLTGMPPCNSATRVDPKYQLISEGKLQTILDEYNIKNISADGIDLLHKLLKTNPDERISLDGIIDHPWMAVRPQKMTIFRRLSSTFNRFSM